MANADTSAKVSGLGFLWRGASQQADLGAGRKVYSLVLMGIITAVAMADRNIINILLEPIKREIGASDTAMGLLTGTVFAFFFATAAIPLSRLVDKGHRRNLLAIILVIWSAATAACGLASTYFHLLIARIGVASALAPANPAIMSIIGDMYPPSQRAKAISVTIIGVGFGVLLGSFLGGWLADEYGWRTAFIAVGLPGVFLALLLFWSAPEPIRGASEGGVKAAQDSATLKDTMSYVAKTPTFTNIVLGKSFMQISTQAQLIWAPAFLIRVHDMTLTQVGLYYGLAISIGVMFAAIISGVASDRLAKKGGPIRYMHFCVGACLVAAPVAVVMTLAQSAFWAVIMIFFYALTAASQTTPSLAAGLAVVRPRMRGFSTASMYFVIYLVGAGLGGLIVGMLNDYLDPRYGDEAIRYSLLIMPVGMSLAALFYFFASRTMKRDAARALQIEAAA